MSDRLLLVALCLTWAACSGPQTAPPAPPVEARVADGPFEAALRWAAQQGPDAVIERMHRAEDGYRVLVATSTSFTLLSVSERQGTWMVTKQEPAQADYLWPTQ